MEVHPLLFQKTKELQLGSPLTAIQDCHDTFVNHICHKHGNPIPCGCGQDELTIAYYQKEFDPMRLNKMPTKHAIAVYVATIILVLVLSETVSPNGLRVGEFAEELTLMNT